MLRFLKKHPLFCFTFFFLAVAAHVRVVAVERSCCRVRTAAVILSIQCVDGDVDQMEDYFTAVHVSVRVLWCIENTMSLCCISVILFVIHTIYNKI